MIIYFVSPEHITHTALLSLVRKVADAGVEYIQYRTKEAFSNAVLDTAHAIHEITRKYTIPLIINDNIELARQIGAEGVHVGQDDTPVEEVYKALPHAIIGLSLNSLSDFDDAKHYDKYITYYSPSPLFHTETKDCINPPFGLMNLQKLRECTKKQIIPIGGINADNIYSVMQHGADGSAFVSAIASSPFPTEAIQAIRNKANPSNTL